MCLLSLRQPPLPYTGLDGQGMRLHLYAPMHNVLKTHMWYIAHLQHGMMYNPLSCPPAL